jgi:sugar/nucleoside kinase (ribokinase family)
MTTIHILSDAVRDAWASIPAPPAEDLKYMAWGWGEEAARAFTGVAPMDVDITSGGFDAATPLLDLPPRASAAYLGTYLVALLRSLELQKTIGIFYDVNTRAHVITCLATPHFWERAVKPFLPPRCREVLAQVTLFVASEHETLALTPEDVDIMKTLAAELLTSA